MTVLYTCTTCENKDGLTIHLFFITYEIIWRWRGGWAYIRTQAYNMYFMNMYMWLYNYAWCKCPEGYYMCTCTCITVCLLVERTRTSLASWVDSWSLSCWFLSLIFARSSCELISCLWRSDTLSSSSVRVARIWRYVDTVAVTLPPSLLPLLPLPPGCSRSHGPILCYRQTDGRHPFSISSPDLALPRH